MKDRDKYLKLVEWSEEDNCYVGSIPGWIGKCCHGDDEIKVYQELSTILDEWIEIYKKENRPLPSPTNRKFSGKFVLRTSPELHQAIAMKAMSDGKSLNAYVVSKLKAMIGQ